MKPINLLVLLGLVQFLLSSPSFSKPSKVGHYDQWVKWVYDKTYKKNHQTFSKIFLKVKSEITSELKGKNQEEIKNTVFKKILEDFFSLTALTLNVGLVHEELWGVPYAYVPFYHVRKPPMLTELLGQVLTKEKGPDVVFLQEIWYQDDFNAIIDAFAGGPDAPYIALVSKKDWATKGEGYCMQTLVRKEILQEGSSVSSASVTPYENSYDNDEIRSSIDWAVGLKKGVLHGSIVLKNGKKVFVANTHLTAGTGKTANEIRSAQIRKLIDILKEEHFGSYTLLGADFNLSPEFEKAQEGTDLAWEENRYLYVNFFRHTHLVDTFKALHPDDPGYTWDKDNNVLVREGPGIVAEEPLQRVDFVYFGKFHISNLIMDDFFIWGSKVVAKGPAINFKSTGKSIPLSDHYGVLSKIILF